MNNNTLILKNSRSKDSTKQSFQWINCLLICFFFVNNIKAQSFSPAVLEIIYRVGNEKPKTVLLEWNKPFANDALKTEMQWLESENRYIVRIRALAPISFQKVSLNGTYSCTGSDTRYFCNGFQSWTTSREYVDNERIPRLSRMLDAYSKNAGDYYLYKYPRKKGMLHSWTWTYWRDAEKYHILASLAEPGGFTHFRFDTNTKQIFIEKDLESLQLAADKSFEVFDFIYAEADGYAAYSSFMEDYSNKWRKKYSSSTPADAPAAMGWTSWYYHYAKIDEKLLENNLNAFAEKQLPIDIFQIDDGYQQAVGDWLITNKKFPNGMKVLADKIHAKGFKAGIWLAPFVAAKKSDVFKTHPDWFVKKQNGKALMVAKNIIWKGPYYALDIYHPEARSYIKKVLQTILREWNYDLIKVDFLFGACLQGRPDRTRGQIMYDGMQLLREVAGKDKMILGCGVPLASAFGMVDYCRIGNDAHTGWELKPLKKLHAHERPSTWSTLTNSINRAVLSGRFFQNDPDVFILRNKKTNLSETQKNTMFLVNQLFGEVLFISDDIREYDILTLQLYKSGFNTHKKEITNINMDIKNIYVVNFKIGAEEFIAYFNLGGDSFEFIVPENYLPESEMGDFQIADNFKQKKNRLLPYQSKLYRLSKQTK
jgi:alpha-galactosidase